MDSTFENLACDSPQVAHVETWGKKNIGRTAIFHYLRGSEAQKSFISLNTFKRKHRNNIQSSLYYKQVTYIDL